MFDRQKLIIKLKNQADLFADTAHKGVSQKIITWQEHENLMKAFRKMMREIAKIEQNNNTQGGH